MNKKTYTEFEEWNTQARELGWTHCHDEFIVCDDGYGGRIGEFDSKTDTGWILFLED